MWKPIKDLTVEDEEKIILLYSAQESDNYGIGVRHWEEDGDYDDPSGHDGKWYVYNNYEEQLYGFYPTHFMVLTPPQGRES
jgi:hypothetical protein